MCAHLDHGVILPLRDVLGTEGLERLLASFEDQAVAGIAELTRFTSDREAGSRAREAHRLRGAALALGFRRVGEALSAIENGGAFDAAVAEDLRVRTALALQAARNLDYRL